MNLLRMIALIASTLALVVTTAEAADDMYLSYYCWMEGSQVVPPSGQSQIGGGCFYLTGNEFTYQISFWQAPGFETEAHIHGPAAAGENAPIIFTLPPGDPQGNRYGVLGPLDLQQLHDLGCGLWYVDVHTVAHPLGEVRGQVKGLIIGGAPNPCTLPTGETTWGAVKILYR